MNAEVSRAISMTKRQTSVVIDPVAMNIANKVAAGSKVTGDYATGGGILIEGQFRGNLHVTDGPLVLLEGGHLSGCIEVQGDAYIFGTIGADSDDQTTVTVRGELHLTSKCHVHGRILFAKLATYQGANVHGSIESLVQDEQLAGS